MQLPRPRMNLGAMTMRRVSRIPQSSSMNGASQYDYLMASHDIRGVVVLPSAEMQSIYSTATADSAISSWRRRDRIKLFPMVFGQREMQTASSKIWTGLTELISSDDSNIRSHFTVNVYTFKHYIINSFTSV